MATLVISVGGMMMAAGIGWLGIQGLRGVPDSTGKVTGKGTAIACVAIAIVVAAAAIAAPYLMWD